MGTEIGTDRHAGPHAHHYHAAAWSNRLGLAASGSVHRTHIVAAIERVAAELLNREHLTAAEINALT
jgi:hypothetical protein